MLSRIVAFSRKTLQQINEKNFVQDSRDEARMRGRAALKSLKWQKRQDPVSRSPAS